MIWQNPAAWRRPGVSRWRRGRRWLCRSGAAGMVAVCAGCGVPASGSGFLPPPRQAPVTGVLVSGDGRVVTGVGGMACGHEPRLVARSYPAKVTLTWVNPDTNCDSETLRSAVVRIKLAEPLGNRPLVQASGGGRIPYFDERDLARVTVLPAGYRFRQEFPAFPAGQPAGDTRTYVGPPGTGAIRPGWPCRCAQLAISQQVITRGFIPPTKQTSQHPVHVLVNGRVAALLVNGPFYDRSVNWTDHGYFFTVGASVYGPEKAPLSDAQLIAVADGIQLSSAQYR